MTNTNRTTINTIVNAIFATGKDSTVADLSAPKAYVFGLFAQEDIKALMSALWSKRSELVRLMYVADKPIFDGQPAEGSLEANDTGKPDENAEERANAVKAVALEVAIIERRIKSLEMQAKEESEEAGKKTADGGRFRFNLKQRQFKSYMESWDEWLVKQKAEAEPNGIWLAKLELAQEGITLPHVSAQDAIDAFKDAFDDSYTEKVSAKAWDRLLDRFEQIGQCMANHDLFMAQCTDDDKAAMAVENKAYRADMKSHQWWLDNVLLQPVSLLAHNGAPKHIINSPEWRTMVAKRATSEANANVAEAMAEVAEVQALTLQTQATMAIMDARAMLEQAQAALVAQQAALSARLNPVPAPAPEAPAPQEEAQAEAPKPNAKGRAPRVHNGKGAAGFSTH